MGLETTISVCSAFLIFVSHNKSFLKTLLDLGQEVGPCGIMDRAQPHLCFVRYLVAIVAVWPEEENRVKPYVRA